jgi:hypothetical protein
MLSASKYAVSKPPPIFACAPHRLSPRRDAPVAGSAMQAEIVGCRQDRERRLPPNAPQPTGRRCVIPASYGQVSGVAAD